jgi:leader peptidase (prepilin peptidase)/N-methyltransferase
MLNDGLMLLLGSLFALSVGSFLNVVVYRLPLMILQPEKKLSLALPRSHCPLCHNALRKRDNIPLLSWLALRGRCHHCAHPISVRYPATELATLILSLFLAWLLPWDTTLLAALLLCWMLLALTLIDMEHQLLPDALTLSLLWLGLVLQALAWLPGSLNDAVLGAAIGYLALWLLATGYRYWRGIDALGLGDAKLLAALGAWLGWQMLPTVLLIAAGGGIVTVILRALLFKRPLHQPLPFGPMLAFAGALMFVYPLV